MKAHRHEPSCAALGMYLTEQVRSDGLVLRLLYGLARAVVRRACAFAANTRSVV